MRRGLIVIAAVAGLAGAAHAQTAAAWDAAPNPLLPSRSLGGLLQQPGPAVGTVAARPAPSNSRYVLPVALSAVVPGMGEIVTGHWLRGLPFVAADVATWVFYGHFQSEGRDWRSTYESFADAHWHYDFWQQNLAAYYDDPNNPNYDFYDPNSAYNCTCPYIPKEQDRQHYYENVGKYLYYYPGWEDWVWNGDPATSDSQHLRYEYGQMRLKSNDNFDYATDMLYVAMATRLASMVQTVLLIRNDTRDLEVRPMRLSGRGAGLEIAVRY